MQRVMPKQWSWSVMTILMAALAVFPVSYSVATTIFGSVRGIVHDPATPSLSRALTSPSKLKPLTGRSPRMHRQRRVRVQVGAHRDLHRHGLVEGLLRIYNKMSLSSPTRARCCTSSWQSRAQRSNVVVSGTPVAAPMDTVTPDDLAEPRRHPANARRRSHQRRRDDHRLRACDLRGA